MIINKKIIVAVLFLFSLLVSTGNVFSEDTDPCAVVVDLENGIMELPCVDLYVDTLDENDEPVLNENNNVVQEVGASCFVNMDRRGGSYNWEVTFAELDETIPQESECSSEVDLAAGTLHIPCLLIEGEDGELEVYMTMSQHGDSSNWEVLLINNSNGEEIYYKNGDEDGDDGDDGDGDDCPDTSANQNAKDNHPECSYE